MRQVHARFQNAILHARQLPPDLLTNSQKLKLYALYKQTETPAPQEPPPKTNALARAKWEAWNDVRSLSELQAMESYCAIIEGLVSMMESSGTLPMPADAAPPSSHAEAAPAPAPAPVPAPAPAPAPQSAKAPPRKPPPPPPAAEPADGGEPKVECTTWTTSAMTVAPGASVDVPLDASEPCLCTYTFSTTDAASAVGFSIGAVGGSGAPLVALRQAAGEGRLTVGEAGLLHVTLDNGQAMFMPLTVACTVSLAPLAQLRRREEWELRQSLRAELADNEQQQRRAAEREAQIVAEEAGLVAQLTQLQAQVAQCQQALARKGSELVQSERLKMELAGEQASLKMQLRKTLWKMPREWLDALPKTPEVRP